MLQLKVSLGFLTLDSDFRDLFFQRFWPRTLWEKKEILLFVDLLITQGGGGQSQEDVDLVT